MAKATTTKARTPPTGVKPRVALQDSPRPSRGPVAALAVVPPTNPPQKPRKQRWTGLTSRSKMRKTAAAIVSLRVQGLTADEISAQLSIKPATIRQYLWIAGKNGWLTTSDPHDYAENVIIHKVVKGLEELVDARNPITGLPDREVHLESAKGFGIFKDHSKPSEAVNQQANMLTINVVMPEGGAGTIRPGTTSGTAAYAEGEILHATPRP